MNFRNRFFRCLLCASLVSLLIVNAHAAAFGAGVVQADALRLRAQPNTRSTVVAMAYEGAKVEVLEDAVDGWYKVTYNGKTGYMSAQYLVVTPAPVTLEDAEVPLAAAPDAQAQDEPAAQSEAEPAAEKEDKPAGLGNGKVSLSSGTLNLRSGPSTQHKRLASIPNGTVLALEAESGGWYQVTYAGVTGYVSGTYIVKTNEALPSPTQGSATGAAVAELAKQYVGCPYSYGATGPKSFDCSGFTYYIYKQVGHPIGRGGSSQFYQGTSVARANLQPGDLVFFRDPATAGSYPMTHVGIYIGGNQFVHAASAGRVTGVKISNLTDSWYTSIYAGARRIV